MEKLGNRFLKIYLKELADLEIGYSFNKKRIKYLRNILSVIYYLKYGNPTIQEGINLIEQIV